MRTSVMLRFSEDFYLFHCLNLFTVFEDKTLCRDSVLNGAASMGFQSLMLATIVCGLPLRFASTQQNPPNCGVPPMSQ